MNPTLILAVALVLAAQSISPHLSAGQTPTTAEIVRRAHPAVVVLKNYDSRNIQIALGSGFLVANGRIVTNHHVVAGASRVEVLSADGRLLGVSYFVEALSATVDLVVLSPLPEPPAVLVLARKEPDVGERVLVIGAPEGLTNTVTDGIVSAIRNLDGRRMMQISAPISSGSSGGPVLNELGEVIGVSAARMIDGQNLNFAVPITEVRALVGMAPERLAFPPLAGDSPQRGPVTPPSTNRPPPTTRAELEASGDDHEAAIRAARLTTMGEWDLGYTRRWRLFGEVGHRLQLSLRDTTLANGAAAVAFRITNEATLKELGTSRKPTEAVFAEGLLTREGLLPVTMVTRVYQAVPFDRDHRITYDTRFSDAIISTRITAGDATEAHTVELSNPLVYDWNAVLALAIAMAPTLRQEVGVLSYHAIQGLGEVRLSPRGIVVRGEVRGRLVEIFHQYAAPFRESVIVSESGELLAYFSEVDGDSTLLPLDDAQKTKLAVRW